MNLGAIREDLRVVAESIGFNAWSYQPDDPKDLPAAVIGGIKGLTRLNQVVSQIQLGVSFFCNLNDPQDATNRLDLALSVGVDGSFVDALDAITPDDSPAWRSCKFVSAGPYLRYQMPANQAALGCEAILELTA